jgi:hypothetical protein
MGDLNAVFHGCSCDVDSAYSVSDVNSVGYNSVGYNSVGYNER